MARLALWFERRADDARFGLEPHAEFLLHRRRHAPRERQQLRPGGLAEVDQHQRVLRRHGGVAVAEAAPARLFDQPGRRQLALGIVRRRETPAAREARLQFGSALARVTTGFLKKLPALPATAGSGSLRRRMRRTAAATLRGVGLKPPIAASSSRSPA